MFWTFLPRYLLLKGAIWSRDTLFLTDTCQYDCKYQSMGAISHRSLELLLACIPAARKQQTIKLELIRAIFRQHRACAVLRTPTAEACPKAMQAAIDGGFKIVEFTLTTPGCLNTLADFRAK
jgi:hypothetical protein